MVERRLGRGLDFFLSSSGGDADDPPAADGVSSLELDALVPNPHQPRREFAEAELQTLADSIREAGILQPILVRKVGTHHQIVAGERRWRAARIAGLTQVPVLVRDISDEQSALFGLVENLHREDLNPIEKAQAFRRIQQITKGSQDEVARQVGLDRSTVANFVRLLDLPVEVQAHVSRGTLSMGQARALLAVTEPAARVQLAEQAIRERWSVRQVESAAQAWKAEAPTPAAAATAEPGEAGSEPKKTVDRPLWLREIEDNLCEALRTNVQVRYGRKRSKIQIECLGREEFERVYELLKGLGG